MPSLGKEMKVMWATGMQMMELKKAVSVEEEEIPHDDMPDS